MSEAVARESYCGLCRRVILLDAGGRCRSCKGPRRQPIAPDWAEKSKQVKAAQEATAQSQKIEETAAEVDVVAEV